MKDRFKIWHSDPIQFVRDNFKVEPDAWQINVLKAVATNRRIAMKACKGPGKTCLLAWVAWWFLVTRDTPKMAATSISWDNLSDGLWAEMSKWGEKSTLIKEMFTITKTRIFYKHKPETWFMSARTWAKGASGEQQANTLAGLHADNIMFILDEAGGIPDAVMAAAEAALSSGHDCKILMAGNPTHLEGPLYRACSSERKLWHVTEISSDPDDPNRTPRVSKEWAKEQIEKYGRDNPWVLVNVFGQFPPASFNALLGITDVEKSMHTRHHEHDYAFMQKRLGIDVARSGADSTVIFPRQGLMAYKPVEMRNQNNNQIAARVMAAKFKWNSEAEFVDGTGGFGSGVVDALLLNGVSAQEIHFSSSAINPVYANKRAEMHFLMAEWIKRGGSLPLDEGLKRQLLAITYTFDKKGRFLIEPKEEIKAKLQGESPDKADALALTFALPEQKTGLGEYAVFAQMEGARGKVKIDHDGESIV